ncbi:hypothetical protein FBY39_2489 [Microbacterium sp. SLBN-146]|nr:hypothetical protein FBY39_2489 [Microbacterium sp. SLBN-146]
MPARTTTPARVTAIVAAITLAGLLAGCTGDGTAPEPTAPVVPTSEPTSVEPSEPSAPALVSDGSASDNLPLFAQVVAAVWGSPENLAGRAYVDALVAAGFDKTAMQVTEDFSTVGNPAESLQFSVLWGGECLVGQVGPATGEPVTAVMPALVEGGCLIGSTRPIDW